VDHGEALVALDRGLGVVWASADGDQEVWRRSGGRWWPEQWKMSENVCVQRKNEYVRDSRTCSGSRTGRD
jgi:hypothetical protein